MSRRIVATAIAAIALFASCGGDDEPQTLEQSDLEQRLEDEIQEGGLVTGTPVITCPGDLTIETGETIECSGEVEESPGESTPIAVEVLEDGELDVTVGEGE